MAPGRVPSVQGAGLGDADGNGARVRAQRVDDIKVIHAQQLSSLNWNENPFGILSYAALGIFDAAKGLTKKAVIRSLWFVILLVLSVAYVSSTEEPGVIMCSTSLMLNGASKQMVFVRSYAGMVECTHWYGPTVTSLLRISGAVLADAIFFLYGNLVAEGGMRKVMQGTRDLVLPEHWVDRCEVSLMKVFLRFFTEFAPCVAVIASVSGIQLAYMVGMVDAPFGGFLTGTVVCHSLRALRVSYGRRDNRQLVADAASAILFGILHVKFLRHAAREEAWKRVNAHVESFRGQPTESLRARPPVSLGWAMIGTTMTITFMEHSEFFGPEVPDYIVPTGICTAVATAITFSLAARPNIMRIVELCNIVYVLAVPSFHLLRTIAKYA